MSIWNALKLVAFILGYYSYQVFIAERLPEDWKGLLNVVLVPFIFGLVAYLIYSGSSLVRVALVALIPLPVLVFTLGMRGGDSVAPGLQYWLIAAIVVCFCVGSFAAIGFNRLASKAATNSQ